MSCILRRECYDERRLNDYVFRALAINYYFLTVYEYSTYCRVQTVVTAHLKSKQLLLFAFGLQRQTAVTAHFSVDVICIWS